MASQSTLPTEKEKLENVEDDDEEILVSEFPPPPFYYKRAWTSSGGDCVLQPPSIPRERLKEYSAKAAEVMKRAVAEMEAKFVDDGEVNDGDDEKKRKRIAPGETETIENESETPASDAAAVGDAADPVDLSASMVTIFGDVIVEDPLLACVPDDCSDPTKVRDSVIRLNRKVMQGYATLVNELVHKPLDNKRCRDELSHNVLLMLHECNKFREHQAREFLIQNLENQLDIRRSAVNHFRREIAVAKLALKQIQEVTTARHRREEETLSSATADRPPVADVNTGTANPVAP